MTIDNVRDLIALHEGFRQHPYLCPANKLSVGFGRNLEDKGIRRHEAEYLLGNDIEEAIAELRSEPYWLDLDEVRQAVMIDMAVNLGWPRLSLFRKLREALFHADYAEAAKQMVQSKWYGQVGNRSRRLVRMMESGEWPTSP